MKRKIIWSALIYSVMAALLIASCTQTIADEEEMAQEPAKTSIAEPTEESTGILRIKVTKPDGSPCANLEVDLWTSSAPKGPPDTGRATTDTSGIANFEVAAGDYKIGFNLNNFPTDEFTFPKQKTLGTVEEGDIAEVIIQLNPKGLQAETDLRVQVTKLDGSPCANLEVDLLL